MDAYVTGVTAVFVVQDKVDAIAVRSATRATGASGGADGILVACYEAKGGSCEKGIPQ